MTIHTYDRAHELALGRALDKLASQWLGDASEARQAFADRLAANVSKGYGWAFGDALKWNMEDVIKAETRTHVAEFILALRRADRESGPLTGAEVLAAVRERLTELVSAGIMPRSTGVMHNVVPMIVAYEADRLGDGHYGRDAMQHVEWEAERATREQLVGEYDATTAALRAEAREVGAARERARSETRRAELDTKYTVLIEAAAEAQKIADGHYAAQGGPVRKAST